MPQISPNQIDDRLDTLCDHYLPRVLGYFKYWVEDMERAEDLAVETLKGAIRKIDGLGQISDSLSIKIFSLARRAVKFGYHGGPTLLSGLSSRERQVIALKMGAELSNYCIGAVLGLPEEAVRRQLRESLGKLENRVIERQPG